jgi:hypothetical protein
MISINDFEFTFVGYGHYKVTYTSPSTWKKWTNITSDMMLIDATKNCGGCAKKINLNNLKRICKAQLKYTSKLKGTQNT